MKKANVFIRSLAAVAIILAAGCAPAYHSYSDCYVDCRYCAPPPLPYPHYKSCVCHSCAAARYLSAEPPAMEEDAETDTDE